MQRFIYCSISFTVTPSTAIPRPGDSNSVDKQTQGGAANFRPTRCLPHFQNEMKSETLLSLPSLASLSVNVRGATRLLAERGSGTQDYLPCRGLIYATIFV
ncbi:hypothetical protein TNCT_557541 [Trichonephila clavata]|uniref:Uncharacterized protein n=1 Tax=Trichonephila clavata TaxID=2740835 RepID=A0A8X6GAY4_TRICU|nr:hypothetical protein TNCT_239691 [Trichonephila clavata]GFQ98234.1 hypothetical protein TNCT_557541 [Trichonephila clavata]